MTSIRTTTILAAGLTFGALPAAAQTAGLCNGAGDNGQWIGGNEAASDIATAGTFLEGTAIVLPGSEYVSLFTVSTATEVRVEAQGSGAGDPVIDLLDESGAIVLSDDDSGGGGSSRGEIALSPGSYCLSLTSYDGGAMTGVVRVGRSDQEALTQGLSEAPLFPPVDATPDNASFGCSGLSNYLGDGGSINASLAADGVSATASVNEVDAWGFTLSESTALAITAENPSADPVITLYDGAGNYLAENDDWDGLNSRIEMIGGLDAGEYCIEMRALSDNGAPITVSVVGYDEEEARIAQYDRGDASPPLDGSHPVTDLGILPNRLRQDVRSTDAMTWFSFEMDAPGLVVLETASGGQGDSVMVLFDDFGRQLDYNDDANDSLDSQIIQRVNAGMFVVGVKQLGDGQQASIRLLLERWVPAQ